MINRNKGCGRCGVSLHDNPHLPSFVCFAKTTSLLIPIGNLSIVARDFKMTKKKK